MKTIIYTLFFVVLAACSNSQAEPASASAEPVQVSSKSLIVDGSQLESLIASGVPIMIDFNATWCGPCKTMKPIVEELAKQYEGKVTFVSLDTDKFPQYAQQFGISSIPTFVVMEKGEVLWGSEGSLPKSMLEEPLKKYQAP